MNPFISSTHKANISAGGVAASYENAMNLKREQPNKQMNKRTGRQLARSEPAGHDMFLMSVEFTFSANYFTTASNEIVQLQVFRAVNSEDLSQGDLHYGEVVHAQSV
ncbi:hypothetical protein EVAR_37789_1 [Eumeta japonica]|uniref:Uncharacterized protein n=1 Tax=Eumeta variegata TaxID=151549 RepID=A0A4C1W9S5_EUMVA|nr:hypothetical protein EVAR_37789_1 [Eumeta japonica]